MAESTHLWCQRCVRKLRTDPKHVCEAPGSSKRVKCQLCSKDSHYCEKDMAPPQLQATVRVLAAQGSAQDKLEAALRLWEGNSMQALCVAWLTWRRGESKEPAAPCSYRGPQGCCNNYARACPRGRLPARFSPVSVCFCACSEASQGLPCSACWPWSWSWSAPRCLPPGPPRLRLACVCFRLRLACAAGKSACCRACPCACSRAARPRSTW